MRPLKPEHGTVFEIFFCKKGWLAMFGEVLCCQMEYPGCSLVLTFCLTTEKGRSRVPSVCRNSRKSGFRDWTQESEKLIFP
ncbi:hypothetical protein [Desulfonema magnum]|uniref:Uncharacterized protein n=1 Tax=Desulfonema magnum TaxID=45655 RepID=A0A975GP96_9BACT|nr:hypothetical protein [Desulfonema magnum]QTA88781.1 Uncharacterized protein dnm_048280 [Desulfonema magnum]